MNICDFYTPACDIRANQPRWEEGDDRRAGSGKASQLPCCCRFCLVFFQDGRASQLCFANVNHAPLRGSVTFFILVLVREIKHR